MITRCNLCDISYNRTHIVNGEGNLYNNDIFIIGEAPGYYEDKYGKPFIGESGKYLRGILKEAGFKSTNIYVTNIIKCRPPNNRTPTRREIRNCSHHLITELRMAKPRFVILLGRTAYSNFFKDDIPMSKLVTTVKVLKPDLFVAIAYHPSYILRNINLFPKDYYLNYFKKLLKVYKKYLNINY